LFYSFLLFHFSLCPFFEKAKNHQRIAVRYFCLVRNEPCCIAFTAGCKYSNEMGFHNQGRTDLNVLYRVANIPDRKPVLSIK
jgi:hypothetical protein